MICAGLMMNHTPWQKCAVRWRVTTVSFQVTNLNYFYDLMDLVVAEPAAEKPVFVLI